MASQAFDASSAILSFLADTTSTSLELPHMTTGQRKQTKKLVEQYPELTCTSYGLGQERQLRIFKRQEAAGTWSGEITCDTTEPRSPIARAVQTVAMQRLQGPDGKREGETPSTAASSNGSAATSATPTPRADEESPPMQLATPVRNTFIHYSQPADARIVQSMPHGMFGQCLITDLSGDATVDTPGVYKAPGAPPQNVQALRPAISCLKYLDDTSLDGEVMASGVEVVITGLSKLPAFNGLKGTIQSFDEETSRFSVLLMEPIQGHKWVKVKRENLEAVVSLPPPRSPTTYVPEVQTTPTWDVCSAHTLSLTALV